MICAAALLAVLCSFARDEELILAWAKPEVAIGDQVELSVSLTGECAVDAELLPLPAIDAATFEIVEGPTTSTTADGDYRCEWRVIATPRRTGPLVVSVHVECQSSTAVDGVTAPITVTGSGEPEPIAAFELSASAARVFVGEPVTVDLVVRGPSNLFSAYDVEAELPWFHDVVVVAARTSDAVTEVPVAGETARLRFERIEASADRVALRASVTIVVPEPMRLPWAGSRLRATRREPAGEGDVDLDVPLATGTETIDVLPLPAGGKPADFVDAIGRYRIEARADRAEATVGEPFVLTIVVDAEAGDEGNLVMATLPHAWPIAGFRVALRDDERLARSRRFVFELRAERAGLLEIPALSIPSFDPKTKSYVVARSEPIPLRVVERTAPLADAARERTRRARLIGLVGIVIAAVLASIAWTRSRRRHRGDAQSRDAKSEFERAWSESDADDRLACSKALARAIHAALGIDPGALFGGGARAALDRSDLAPELVDKIAQFIDADETAAFSAGDAGADSKRQRLDEARSLVEALARAHGVRAN